MAYTRGNKCVKNCCKRTILVQLIVEDVVTWFFSRHRVHVVHLPYCLPYRVVSASKNCINQIYRLSRMTDMQAD